MDPSALRIARLAHGPRRIRLAVQIGKVEFPVSSVPDPRKGHDAGDAKTEPAGDAAVGAHSAPFDSGADHKPETRAPAAAHVLPRPCRLGGVDARAGQVHRRGGGPRPWLGRGAAEMRGGAARQSDRGAAPLGRGGAKARRLAASTAEGRQGAASAAARRHAGHRLGGASRPALRRGELQLAARRGTAFRRDASTLGRVADARRRSGASKRRGAGGAKCRRFAASARRRASPLGRVAAKGRR
mmetsp:Transcript_29881/g.102917  ORF Transcript_29881/g.102917 Transcript_29881/m.102917 type:complete len:242 (+) Transcript_29881:177-902(+)